MKEIITVQLGGCGNRIGVDFWNSIAFVKEDGINNPSKENENHRDSRLPTNVFFNEKSNGLYSPRAILADLEPNSLTKMFYSPEGNIFNPSNILLGQYSASNWAKGMYSEGCELVEQVEERIRSEAELCDCLQGFQVMQSIGGGTGSGFGSLLMSRLRDEYSDRIISTFTVIPSSKVSGFPIEPYNAVFAAHYLLSDTNACVVLDNETIYANLYLSGKTPVEVEKRTNFEDLNAVIETAINNVTRVFRFPGQLHGDFRKFVLKMVPVPRLQFLTVGCVPMCYSNHLALQMNKSVMSAYSTTARFAHTCIFRGSVSCKRACNFMKDYVDLHQAQFLKCSPTFNVIHNSNKTCFNHVEDGEIHMSFIENNAGTVEVWKRVYKEFRYLYKRKAFLSCYISEGMDEGEVVAAQKSLIELISDYSSYAPQRTGLEVH